MKNGEIKLKLRKTMGENIKRERIKKGLKRDDLIELLGVSTAYLGLVERGYRGFGIDTLCKLSKILDIPIDNLIKEDIDKDTKIESPMQEAIKTLLTDMNENDLQNICEIIRAIKKIGKNQS